MTNQEPTYVREASELGWTPGTWAGTIDINGTFFKLVRMTTIRGDIQWWDYRSTFIGPEGRALTLRVFND